MFKDFFRYKKGGEKLLSVWWFLVLAIVGAGIVVGVLIFYSADVNIKEVESGILYEKLADCFVDNGFLVEGINNENIFEKCDLEKSLFEEGSNFYFRVIIYNEKEEKLSEISFGREDFIEDCDAEKKIRAKHFPKCVGGKESVFYYDDKIKKGAIEILAISNQNGKKISAVENE